MSDDATTSPLAAFLDGASGDLPALSAGTVNVCLSATLPDGTQIRLSHALDSSELLPALRRFSSRGSAALLPAQKLQAVVSTQRACKSEISKLHRQVNTLAKTVAKELTATRKEALAAVAAGSSSTQSPSAGLFASGVSNSGGGGGGGGSGSSMTTLPPQTIGVGQVPAIGHIESCFVRRNGTPRQPGLASAAASRLRVTWGTCPAHALDGLRAFSHVWLLFVFDQNRGGLEFIKSKVKPPRLDGQPTGLFACRTPHRPNPIGLSLVRLERVEHDTLVLAGADLIDGTPILDIKPYIPYADAPRPTDAVRAPDWVSAGAVPRLQVEVTDEARAQLRALCGGVVGAGAMVAGAVAAGPAATAPAAQQQKQPLALRFYAGRPEAAEQALVELLQADPRSVYRKQKCGGQSYLVTIDGLEASCRFDPIEGSGPPPPLKADVEDGAPPSAPVEVARVLAVRLECAAGGAPGGTARAEEDEDEAGAGLD